jgi:hypothetical protein
MTGAHSAAVAAFWRELGLFSVPDFSCVWIFIAARIFVATVAGAYFFRTFQHR